jgi:hypothetical protein
MPGMGSSEMGGAGGGGGAGDSAEATVEATQTSGVNVEAECVLDINGPAPTATFTDCTITFEIGWVSAANPDWIANLGTGAVWDRAIAMTVTVGNSAVVLNGSAGTVISLDAIDDSASPYYKTSSVPLDSDTGSFGLGVHEIGFTSISIDDTASIITPDDGISSVLRGGMMSYGGEGGSGGEPGMDLNGSANDGNDGADGGSPTGAFGGAGGQGGIPRPQDTNGDMVDDTTSQGGGDGGDGGDGQKIDEHKDGIFQGVISIELDY